MYMEFRVLGSLEAVAEGRSLALGAAKQRALLAVLVLNDNRIVSTDRLIDALWGEEAADGAAHTVQVYVSALRKALRVPGSPAPETILVTQGPGYVLRVEPETIDLHRFERIVGEGRRALAAGEPARAADLLEEALGLWRGPPLVEFAHEAFAQPDIARIEDLRLSAVEDRIEADLDLGRQAEVLGELRSLVADHPLRERLRGHLMLALYRSGRQSEALDVYRDGRQQLVDELGIDPSPDLQRLERAILEQDPELEVAVPRATHPRPAPRRRRTRTAVAALVVMATLVVTVVVVVARTSESPPPGPSLEANSVVRIDPASGRLAASIPTAGNAPTALVSFDGSLWVANTASRTVARIDPATDRVELTVPTEGTPTALAAGEGAVWVLNGLHGSVLVIDPRTNDIAETIEVPAGSGGIAVGAGAVWVTNTLDATVTKIDPQTREIDGTIPLGEEGDASPKAIAASGDDLWVGDEFDALVWQIAASTGGVVWSPGLRSAPTAIAIGGGAVWVASGAGDLVTRLNQETKSTSTLGVGDGPGGIAVGFGFVWVANSGDGTVSRIDTSTGQKETIPLGVAPEAVAAGSGDLWVSVPG
jgi:DNA-binding SARP family transcriptional activator/streptogramin lyase